MQDFIDAWDAAAKFVRRIEECGVRICDLLCQGQEIARNFCTGCFHRRKLRYGALRPHRPMSQEASYDAHFRTAKIILGEQVEQNVVIVAGIECDLTGASRVGDGSYDVDSLVTIEGCNLDGNNIFNFRELAPKFIRQNAAANGGLQVKAHYWNHGRYVPDVIKKCRN